MMFCIVACLLSGYGALGQTVTRQDALTLEQQGRNEEAAEIWSGIAERDHHNAEAFAHLGLIEARQEHFGQAISYYQRALALDPGFPSLEMNLGLALFKTDQFGGAITAFLAELERHPGDLRLITLLGMAHYAMGDYLVAIPYLQRATESDPQAGNSQLGTLRMALARSCLWSRQYACVVKAAGEVLAVNPGAAEVAVLAGEALAAEGDSGKAMEQFRAAIRTDPKLPEAHLGLGYLLWEQKQYAEAAAEFQAELEVDPANAEARANLGAVSEKKDPGQPLIQVMANAQPPAHP